MKNFGKFLSVAAIATLASASLVSCGKKDNANPEDLIKLVLLKDEGELKAGNFTLPSYVSQGNKDYFITWTTENTDILKFVYSEDDKSTKNINEAKDPVKVEVTKPAIEEDFKEVIVKATIKVGSKSASNEFGYRIEKYKDLQKVYNDFVSASDVVGEFTGFVFAKGGYVDKYNEGNLFIQTEQGGLYVYNGFIDKEKYNSLPLGTYVNVTGAKSSIYNGWAETKFGASIEVLKTPAKNMEEYFAAPKDITNAVGTDDYKFNQNVYAQITGLTLTAKKTDGYKNDATNNQTIAEFTDAKGNKVTLCVNGGLTAAGGDVATAAVAAVNALQVGDVVTLKGVSCAYNGPQIAVLDTSVITKTGHGEVPTPTPGPTPTPQPGVTVVTVEQAYEIVNALEDNKTTTETYSITGVIAGNIEAYNSKYGNATFDIKDEKGTHTLIVFRAKEGEAKANFTADSFAAAIEEGKTVTVIGNLQKYKDKSGNIKLEISGCYIVVNK